MVYVTLLIITADCILFDKKKCSIIIQKELFYFKALIYVKNLIRKLSPKGKLGQKGIISHKKMTSNNYLRIQELDEDRK